MIRSVYIKDYAIISELKLYFENGFTVITGETGAGKSIILGALRLLMGERADIKTIRNKAEKCIIEASFNFNNDVEKILESFNLDIYHTLIIRREISHSGRSRAFINDTPVNLNELKQVSDMLLDINSQHQTLNLQKGWFQINVLDSVAGNNNKLLKEYQKLFSLFSDNKIKLAELVENEQKRKSDLDYLNFVFDEIDKLNYKYGEYEEIESELNILNNAEHIKTNLFSAFDILQESEINVSDKLDDVINHFNSVTKYSSDLELINKRLNSLKIELSDIVNDISNNISEMDLDPERQMFLASRVNEINRLSNKHSLKFADELIEKKSEIENNINTINSSSKSLNDLENEIKIQKLNLGKIADELSKNRKLAAKSIEKSVVSMLNDLGMETASFIVKISDSAEYNSNGKNIVEFLFSANKGIEAQEVSRVASGGELSRLMLSLKTLISNEQDKKSLIFDEIDSGLSGKIAAKVGELLKQISTKKQLIVITHQPQIASLGDFHFKVYKDHSSETTNTFISLLNNDGRIKELAEMLGSDKTHSAVQTAKDLLKN